MKHIKRYNESVDEDMVNDILNIIRDDNSLTIEDHWVTGGDNVAYIIDKAGRGEKEQVSDKYLASACKDIIDRLKNEEIYGLVQARISSHRSSEGGVNYVSISSLFTDNGIYRGSARNTSIDHIIINVIIDDLKK